MTQSAVCASRFTGKERDTESGLDYFGARYYGSNMGRWMSPDWSLKLEAVPYANLENPQSLNLYGYVLNNPVSLFDSDGHDETPEWLQKVKNLAAGRGFVSDAKLESARRAAESTALGNISRYQQNGAAPHAGDNTNNMRLSPSCDSGNHDCTYTLSGMGTNPSSGAPNTYYIWEHQTQPGGGRVNVGPGDNISGGDTANHFDDILTFGLDTYRFFTVSTSPIYNSRKQIPVTIQERGQTIGYEHIYGRGGPVYINGHPQLP